MKAVKVEQTDALVDSGEVSTTYDALHVHVVDSGEGKYI